MLHHILSSLTGAVALKGGYFGSGSELTKVYFTNVSCTGHESSITGCDYVTPSTCPHSRDAGVRCLPGPGKLIITTMGNALSFFYKQVVVYYCYVRAYCHISEPTASQTHTLV